MAEIHPQLCLTNEAGVVFDIDYAKVLRCRAALAWTPVVAGRSWPLTFYVGGRVFRPLDTKKGVVRENLSEVMIGATYTW